MSSAPTLAGPLMPTYKTPPVTFVSGEGSWLTDVDGARYLDMVGGLAVASVGHAHPAVVDAISNQAARLIHTSNLYGTQPGLALAERLAALSDGKQSFFANSGAETIECALKLARKWGGSDRTRIIAADGGFHGRTYGALSATGQPSKQAAFRPLVGGFSHIPYGDSGALADALAEDVAAVLLEPIQGEAGVIVPPEGYLNAARHLCTEAGALLILDEVQTGLGRTGYWLAADHEGVDADITCLAKALGGGLPIGACLARPEVASSFEPGDHASTFGGGPVQCAAALAVLDVIETQGLLEHTRVVGAHLKEGLAETVGDRGTVRGRGLLLAVETSAAIAPQIVDGLLAKKVLVNLISPHIFRFCPPLVVTAEEIDLALRSLKEVLDAV